MEQVVLNENYYNIGYFTLRTDNHFQANQIQLELQLENLLMYSLLKKYMKTDC